MEPSNRETKKLLLAERIKKIKKLNNNNACIFRSKGCVWECVYLGQGLWDERQALNPTDQPL